MKRKKVTASKRARLKKQKYILIGLLIFVLFIFATIYLGYRIVVSDSRIFTIRIFAIAAGLVVESLRIQTKPRTVFYSLIGAYFLSYLSILPGKHERHYSFVEHLHFMPYVFVVIFAIIIFITNYEKIRLQLNEGIVLILHCAFLYYCFENGAITFSNFWGSVFTIFLGLATLIILLHAFTKIQLTDGFRLILSLWSSIILMIMSISNVYHIVKSGEIEHILNFNEKLLVGLNNFLLGITAIYILENISMLYRFIPEKGSVRSGMYKYDLQRSKDVHINRFSIRQLSPFLALIIIFLTGSWFVANHINHYLPTNLAIWSLLVLLPVILYLMVKLIPFSRKI